MHQKCKGWFPIKQGGIMLDKEQMEIRFDKHSALTLTSLNTANDCKPLTRIKEVEEKLGSGNGKGLKNSNNGHYCMILPYAHG